jgi:hypothetical protein
MWNSNLTSRNSLAVRGSYLNLLQNFNSEKFGFEIYKIFMAPKLKFGENEENLSSHFLA